MENLVEYLYVDQKRLNSYFDQISESPVAYDKVPTWKGGVGLTKLGTEVTQSRYARPFTTHEKIKQLLKYLKDKEFYSDKPEKLLANFEYYENIEFQNALNKYFHYVEFDVEKIIIPPLKENLRKEIIIWAASSKNSFSIFLLQDGQDGDIFPKVADGSTSTSIITTPITAYSRLYTMAKLVQEQSPLFRDNGTNLESMTIELSRGGNLNGDTVQKLLEIEDFQAIIMPCRRIKSLYRVRYISPKVHSREAASVYGYPIFIAEA